MNVKKMVHVAITSDLVCPWCWVGLRKLQQASKASKIETKITWHPFLLRPNTPLEGQPKGGSPSSRAGTHLRQAGKSVGIDFTGLTDRTPNTILFHATLKYLQDVLELDSNLVTEFHEAIFEGYFTLGVFPDKDGILKLTRQSLSDPQVYKAVFELYEPQQAKLLQSLQEEVSNEAFEASRRGISGVPTFAFNGQVAFSGAQAVSTFVRELEDAAAGVTIDATSS